MNKCIGIQYRNYTSKKTGKPVSGYNVFYTFEQKNMEGIACDSLWCSEQILEDSAIRVGDEFEALYNRYGRVESIRVSG